MQLRVFLFRLGDDPDETPWREKLIEEKKKSADAVRVATDCRPPPPNRKYPQAPAELRSACGAAAPPTSLDDLAGPSRPLIIHQ